VQGHRATHCYPVHYEGWKHFAEGREAVELELAQAPQDVRQRFRWLPPGVEVELAAQRATRRDDALRE